jgi:hypothetical protein
MRRRPPSFEAPPEALGAACPHCGTCNAEVESLFGGSVSEMMLRCRACMTVFHWVKWIDQPAATDTAGTE